MAKVMWKEIETEEDFLKTFGRNPGWVLSPSRDHSCKETLGCTKLSNEQGKQRNTES